MKNTNPSPNRRQATQPDVPYVMKLSHGLSLFLEVPAHLTTRDRNGEVAFLPEGVRYLDQIRALALSSFDRPTPGHIAALREALDLTQEEMAQKLGVDKLTVSRWERGTARPNSQSLQALARLRRRAARKGVKIAS